MKAQLLSLLFVITCCSASDLTCPEQFDPQNPTFFPHPDCTKYYVCNWQTLLERSCPMGLHWNHHYNYCDYPSQAGCIGGPVVTPPPTAAPTTAKPTDKCPEAYNPDDQPNYLPHEDCTKYYVCSWGGAAIEQYCPAGLNWNQVNHICDYPELAGCTGVVNPSSTAAPAASSTAANEDCPAVYDPAHQVYFPHTDCTKYYICTYEGAKLEQNCPPGLHWSAADQYCDHPDRAQCKSVVGAWTDSTESPETSVQCPLEEDTPDTPVFLPHESDCTKYYVCDHGQPIELHCPAGLFWNAVETTCDTPGHSGCRQ